MRSGWARAPIAWAKEQKVSFAHARPLSLQCLPRSQPPARRLVPSTVMVRRFREGPLAPTLSIEPEAGLEASPWPKPMPSLQDRLRA